jgi:hypothetical protein
MSWTVTNGWLRNQLLRILDLNTEPSDGDTLVYNSDTRQFVPGGGGASEWNPANTYPTGTVVQDRGGLWQATGTNTSSQPAPDNSDWTLVGGTPYVETVLGPQGLLQILDNPVDLFTPVSGKGINLVGLEWRYEPGNYPYTLTDFTNGLYLTINGYASPTNYYIEVQDTNRSAFGINNLLEKFPLALSSCYLFAGIAGGTINKNYTVDGNESLGLNLVPVAFYADEAKPSLSFFDGQPLILTSNQNFQQGVPNATSINAAGLGYAQGDTLANVFDDTILVTVTGVDGLGAVTSYEVTSLGEAVWSPESTLEFGNVGPQEGIGTGFILNIDSVHLGDGTLTMRHYYRLFDTD